MLANYVVLDFETRAATTIKLGVEKYVECPYFDALCLGWEWPDSSQEIWIRGRPLPSHLFAHVERGGLVVVHNKGFEFNVWAKLRARDPRWPELRLEQLRDTMDMCRATGLPGKLEHAAEALRLPVRKDMEGAAIMKQLCVPLRNKKGETGVRFDETPRKHERNAQYCMVDVEVQHAIYRLLPALSEIEQEISTLHERINARGVALDVAAARAATVIVEEEQKRLSAQMTELTGGGIKSARSRKQMLEWLETQGVVIGSLKKTEVAKLLEDPVALQGKDNAKKILQIRQAASKSSTAKLSAMIKNACSDGRARGLYAFYGANTGRSSGKRVQTQNLMRPPKGFKLKHAEQVLQWLRHPDTSRTATMLRVMHGSVMDPIASSLRAFVRAEQGWRFICCDFSNIEGRVLAWLAGEQWKLDAFRRYDTFVKDANGVYVLDEKGEPKREGHDLYLIGAGGILGKRPEDVNDDERQVMGKVPELALGFQGGLGAFTSMGANYGVYVVEKIEDAPATAKYVVTIAQAEEIKVKWREKNAAIAQFWYDLNDAAKAAVLQPGRVTGAGLIEFQKRGDFLQMRLPSGRLLAYAYPSVEIMTTTFYEREVARWEAEVEEAAEEVHTVEGAIRYGNALDILTELLENPDKREQLAFWGINSKSKNKKFGKTRAYGGLLAENATQATARDFQFHAALRVERAGYPIVMHTHDELLTEVPENWGSVNELAQIMCAANQWAPGIPVSAAGWEGFRYWK